MTLNEQFYSLTAMLLTGIWLGLALTTYKRFARFRKPWDWMMLATDFFFWVLQGLIVFLVLLNINGGHLRFYFFLVLAIGFSMYHAFFETFYRRLLDRLIAIYLNTWHFIIKTFYRLLIRPSFYLLKVLAGLVIILSRYILVIVLFLLSVVFFPVRWLWRLVVPAKFRQALGDFFKTWQKRAAKGFHWIVSGSINLFKFLR